MLKVIRTRLATYVVLIFLVLTFSLSILSGGSQVAYCPLPVNLTRESPENLDPIATLGNSTLNELERIVITPSDMVIPVDGLCLFTAKGYNSSQQEIPIQPTWNSTIGNFSEQSLSTTYFFAQTKVAKGTVEASVGGVKGIANVTLVRGEIQHIRIEPNATNVIANGFQSFRCYGYDQFSNKEEVYPSWYTNVGTMINNTLVAQCKVEDGYVNASYQPPSQPIPLFDSAQVTIIPDELVEIEVSPRITEIVAGSTVTFNATGFDQFGNMVEIEIQWPWPSDLGYQDEIDDNVTNLTAFTKVKNGYIRAQVDDIFDQLDIKIVPAELDKITITPSEITVKANHSVTFNAKGTDRYENSVELEDCGWFSSDLEQNQCFGDIASYTVPKQTGTYYVYAGTGEVGSKATVTVVPDNLAMIMIKPDKLEIVAGTQENFSASGYDEFGNPVETEFDWSSDVGYFMDTLFTANTKIGSGTIYVSSGSVYATCQVTVTPDKLVQINVTPSDAEIEPGGELEFLANGYDRYWNPISQDVNWEADIGDVFPSRGESTVFTAPDTTEFGHIEASYGDIVGTADIKVVDKDWEDLKIIGKIPDQEVEEDTPFWHLYLRTYENRYSIGGKWYITGDDRNLFTVTGENSTHDILVFTPIPDAHGSNLVTFWVWNEEGEIDSQDVWIVIKPKNDPPEIINPPDIRMSYHQPYSFDYRPYIRDVDTPIEMLSFTAWDRDDVIDKKEMEPFVIIYNFDRSDLNNSINIRLELHDGYLKVEEDIEVFITENVPPNINPMRPDLEDVVLTEGEHKRVIEGIDENFEDMDGDEITITFSESHVEIIIEDNYDVYMNATTEWFGTEIVVFRAQDEHGAFCEDWVYVTVIPVDDPPIVEQLPTLVVHYDEDYFFNLEHYITDVDTPAEDLGLSTDNEYVTVKGGENLVLRINFPEEYDQETKDVTVTVSDGNSKVSTVLTVKITDNSIPWLIQDIPDVTFREDTRLSHAFNLGFYFIDPDGDRLTYMSESVNVRITIHVNHDVSFEAEKDWYGEEYVIFRAFDWQQAFIETTIKVTVEPVNDPPTLDPVHTLIVKKSTEKISLLDYNINDIDNDINSLEINVTSSDPNLLVFVNGLDVFLIKGDADESFEAVLTINISDGEDAISQDIPVEVEIDKTEPNGKFNFTLLAMFIIIAFILIAIMLAAYVYFYRGFYTIDEIYLVYKDGRLIFHKVRPGLAQKDEDIVTSMLTAIQEFVEETFSQGSKGADMAIKKMQFGGKTIVIEKGENVYIAILLKGKPGVRLSRQMLWAIAHIEEQYKEELVKWNGVVSKLAGTYKYLNILLKKKKGFRERLNFIELTR
jgi:hypothetical protein